MTQKVAGTSDDAKHRKPRVLVHYSFGFTAKSRQPKGPSPSLSLVVIIRFTRVLENAVSQKRMTGGQPGD